MSISSSIPKTRRGIQDGLRRRKWSSVAAWARARGYRLDVTYKAIERWAERPDEMPTGVKTHAIMTQLRQDLAEPESAEVDGS
jgi:hypothetical protein